MRAASALALLLAAGCGRGPASGSSTAPDDAGEPVGLLEAAAARAQLEALLLENVLPFWYPDAIDREHGGYRLNHGIDGRWKGPAPKRLVTQARTLWFFARLSNSPYGRPEHLEAARQGFAFLDERFRDPEFGGYVWETDPTGTRVTVPHKHLYGQAFVLYALAGFIRACDDPAVRRRASELFGVLEDRARDAVHGGYTEFHARDWGPPPDGVPHPLGAPSAAVKTMNTHLHLMEALAAYARVCDDPCVQRRLAELILIQSQAVVRPEQRVCADLFHADWSPLVAAESDRVSYGHAVENVWLLAAACDAAGLSNTPVLGFYRVLFDNAYRYGYDSELGGFFDAGPIGKPADARTKIWWVQAEGLVAALRMYQLTGEARYADAFRRTLDWIDNHQADRENGEWYAEIEDGRPRGAKADAWKGPYHTGRAILECLAMLDAMAASPAACGEIGVDAPDCRRSGGWGEPWAGGYRRIAEAATLRGIGDCFAAGAATMGSLGSRLATATAAGARISLTRPRPRCAGNT